MKASSPALKSHYVEKVVPALKSSGRYPNVHMVPRLVKVSLNAGIDAEADKNYIADVVRDLAAIAGQKPVTTRSRKAVANFKLRAGQVVGARVTLRGDRMWEFLYRLLTVALPTIRDFRGVSAKLDSQGNYSLGIQDTSIFPEISLENVKKVMGLDLTIVTTAKSDDEAREMLKLLGMPFRKSDAPAAASPSSN